MPSGFIPTQDQGYLIVFAQLPDGASLQRAEEVRKQISEIARKVPGIAHTVEFAGFSALDGTNRNNAVSTFLPLSPFEERVKDPRLNGFAIMAAVRRSLLASRMRGYSSFLLRRFEASGTPAGSRSRFRIDAAQGFPLCRRLPIN